MTEHTDDDIYEDQMTRIGLEEGVVFDIDLNSVMRDGKVQTTEVENGFEVRIPVPDTYADKTVYAYYTPDSGDLEVHEATVVKGDSNQYFAVFYTDHFSTYTIGEEPKVLKEISIKSNPSKVEYLEGKDAFDVTGGKITLKYESGKTEDIDMTKDMVSGFDNTKVGKQTLTVTYEGKTATFDVTIKAKSLAGISIKSNPSKVEYLEGKDTLDVTGGKITLTYDNGTTEDIDLTKDMVSGFDNTKVRKQTLTVTYEGKTATFDVTVKAKSLSEISIKSNPTKLEYVEGTDLDVTGGKITLTYDNGTTEEVDLTKEMISGFDNTKVGKQTLTVTYEGKTATFDVTIKAKSVSEISIKSKPDKLEYIEGSKLKVTGGKITLTYDNGTTEDIDMTKEMISGFDNTKVGKQTLTVTYEGKTATFDVTVTEKGKIEEDTEQQEKNAGQASIEVDDDAIDLTEEEEEAMDDGLDIIVSLEVTDITDTVPEEDKKLVEEALQEDMEVAIFLDMSLFKFIEGSTDKTQITETKKPITITFTIPEKYRKEGRTYSIIRVHDGKTDIIKVTPDKNWVVRFTSDKFSTYALAFVDKEEAVKTGDRANALLWIILMGGAACIAAGAAVIFRRRKTTKR